VPAATESPAAGGLLIGDEDVAVVFAGRGDEASGGVLRAGGFVVGGEAGADAVGVSLLDVIGPAGQGDAMKREALLRVGFEDAAREAEFFDASCGVERGDVELLGERCGGERVRGMEQRVQRSGVDQRRVRGGGSGHECRVP
jgi:hypothetical protein